MVSMRAGDYRGRFNRRSFLSGLLAPAIAVAPSKPNIVWIWGDNVAWADLGAYGNARARTPALDTPAIAYDVFPTLAHLAGAKLPADRIYDGQDIWPLLSGQGAFERQQPFVWVYLDNVTAVREGRWKLHVGRRDKPLPQPELYDVEADPGESRRLDKEHPDVVTRLLALVQQYQAGIPKAWRLDYTVRDPRKLKSGVRKQ